LRDKGRGLALRLPYADDNRQWITSLHPRGRDPIWRKRERYWELPKSWLNVIVNRLLLRFGSVWIIQRLRVQEKCAPACMNAQGHECACSCLGANHGMGISNGWFLVSDTFATRWQETDVSCKLLKRTIKRTT